MNVYHLLYQCHAGIGNTDRALHYRDQEITIKEKLYDIEKERQANDLINQYNLERKEFQIQLLEKDNKLQEKEIARSSLLRMVYGVGAIVLTLSGNLPGYFQFKVESLQSLYQGKKHGDSGAKGNHHSAKD